MIKIYRCPIHGEFEHECTIKEPELERCKCGEKVTRVFTTIGYSFHCDGFAGSGFSVPNYK